MRNIVLAAVLALTVAAVAGCGQGKISPSGPGTTQAPILNTQTTTGQQGQPIGTGPRKQLAKTKFTIHAGLAIGAFRHYIYLPYKSNQLIHNKRAIAKALLAAAFTLHEVRLALDDARSSKLLSHALHPLLDLQTKLSSLRSSLSHGSVNVPAIQSGISDAGNVSNAGAGAGQIPDVVIPKLPG